jgi:hypothetical protein
MIHQTKLITLWALTIIGMILHFNYHIGELFYGIDVVREDATGEEPTSVFIIRTLFYHLPMLWIVFILYACKRWMYISLFGISILYALAHASHLFGELTGGRNPSQTSLLTVVFIVSILLVAEHWKALKKQ